MAVHTFNVAPWLRYLLAFVVLGHGLIYVGIGAFLPGPVKNWRGTSGLLGSLVAGERLVGLSIALHVAAGCTLLACAAAVAWAPTIPGWWRPLAIVGSSLGLLAFIVFWDGQTHLLVDEGAIGAVVSLLMLLVALGSATVR